VKDVMTQAEKDYYLLRFHRFQQNRERHFAPLIKKALNNQYKTFTSNITQGVEAALLTIQSGEIKEIIKTLYVDAGTVYGNYIRLDLKKQKARMPIGFSEEMYQLMIDYFGIDILNTSEGITEQTKELIRKVFTEAYKVGSGIDDIVKKLENTELSKNRARVIARTETVTAANKGALFVAKKTGLKHNKEWLSARDDRVRHSHRFMNGQIVGEDDFFNVRGNKMAAPGDRGGKNGQLPVDPSEVVNCRCSVLTVPVRVNGKLVRE
jgi:SPP1 gp7 family putative phage head morphogenesis protein